MKVSKTTINYAAKQCYQLHLMRGIDKSTVAGLACQYFYSQTLQQAFVIVSVNGELVPVKVKKQMKKYYTLVSKDLNNPKDIWTIEFGDYSRGIVQDEMREYRYNNALQNEGEEKREYKIITSGDSQAEIEAAVAELNRK